MRDHSNVCATDKRHHSDWLVDNTDNCDLLARQMAVIGWCVTQITMIGWCVTQITVIGWWVTQIHVADWLVHDTDN